MSIELLVAYGALWLSVYLFIRAIIGFNIEMREEGQGSAVPQMPWLWNKLFPYIRFWGRVSLRLFPLLPDADLQDEAKKKETGGFQVSINVFRKKLAQLLVIAGRSSGLTPDDILGAMILGGLFGLIVGLVCYLLVNFVGLWFICLALGMFLPLIWLRDQAQRRQKEIRKTLPFWLDLLTLSVEAGLDFTAALQRIAGKLPKNAFGEEVNLMLSNIRMGMTRKNALRELARHIQLDELNSVTSALVQADEIGASLGHILRLQAEQMRVRRFQRAEKIAMQTPVKLLFPLIGFIFPTVFIIIFGPIILKYLA